MHCVKCHAHHRHHGLTSVAAPKRHTRALLRTACSVSTAAPEEPRIRSPEELQAILEGVLQEDLEIDLGEVPASTVARNRELTDQMRGALILAPLTRGNHRSFRRLTTEFSAPATMSEMSFARELNKQNPVERARLTPAVGVEKLFGAQIATKTIDEGVKAAKAAKELGANWIDINCGCPIYEASRRGMGAIMLRKPRSLAKMVAGIVRESELPVTVKIRLGAEKVNVQRTVALLARTGAAAVTIHGRTMDQRYRRPADWGLIQEVVAANPELPIIGNGDLLTHYDATRRLEETGCHAVMTGRGALIRPWIFEEFKQGKELVLSAEDRVGIYRRLVALMKEQFGDDDWGRRKAWYFLPWHFSFLCRYRPLPEANYGDVSQTATLMNARMDTAVAHEVLEDLSPLERLLRCGSETAHGEIAAALWDAQSDSDAVSILQGMASSQLAGWEAEEREGGEERTDDRDKKVDDRDRKGGGGRRGSRGSSRGGNSDNDGVEG